MLLKTLIVGFVKHDGNGSVDMPNVNGKKFPYTAKGKIAAKKAMTKKMTKSVKKMPKKKGY
jgi:hypothetical protein